MTASAALVAGACFSAGRWLVPASGGSRAELPPAPTRVARADALTRLAASVAVRAMDGLSPLPPERVASVGATVLASLRTNQRYESRRRKTGRAPPRDFPYTAPNAWLGEVAACVDARGSSLCLVGQGDVGLAALATAIRMIRDGECDRALVVAAESLPPDAASTPHAFRTFAEAATAVVIEPEIPDAIASVSAGWEAQARPLGLAVIPSTHALWEVIQLANASHPSRVTAPAAVGASCWIDVTPARASGERGAIGGGA